MNHTTGNATLLPIILIDDDTDDLELMTEGLASMHCENEVFGFELPAEALAFMQAMARLPYLISCDVHMPKMDAYELRSAMLDDLPHMSHVPFYILSTLVTEREISLADTLQIQGFYFKATSSAGLQQNFRDMIDKIKRPN